MKKLFSLLLTVLMVCGLAACSSVEAEKLPEEGCYDSEGHISMIHTIIVKDDSEEDLNVKIADAVRMETQEGFHKNLKSIEFSRSRVGVYYAYIVFEE